MYFPHPYEPVVARLVQALEANELGAWSSRLFAPDAAVHVDGWQSSGRVHHGATALTDVFAAIECASGAAPRLSGFKSRLDGACGTVQYVLEAATGSGPLVDCQELRLRFENGQIAEAWLQSGSPRAFDELLAAAQPTTTTSRRRP